MSGLGEVGEAGFLRRLASWVSAQRAEVGVGDDAAVLPSGGGSLVASTDLLLEGVHFRAGWSSPEDLGYRAAAVAVSDLAAMGAEPRWLLVGLGAPASTAVGFLAGLYAGLAQAGGEYGFEVVGGDTVRAEQLLVAVTALGELDGPPLRRCGARPGDLLGVTGPLGRAAAGVRLLAEGGAQGADAEACLAAYRRPRARVAEGRALRLAGAAAAIDLSDGLASDARWLAEASGVGVELDADALPVAPEVTRLAAQRGWDAEALALGGGEDYELLAAASEEVVARCGLIPVGRVVEEGAWLRRGGRRSPLPELGWDHFR